MEKQPCYTVTYTCTYCGCHITGQHADLMQAKDAAFLALMKHEDECYARQVCPTARQEMASR